MAGFAFTFFGVRGSYAVAGPQFLKYGGNTACILCAFAEANIILDAGTGIINLGRQLVEQKAQPRDIHVFISHYHMDHIQGLPFFPPLYEPGIRVVIHSPPYSLNDGKNPLHQLFSSPYSPIGWDSIQAKVEFRSLESAGTAFCAKGVRVQAESSSTHPREGVWAFRVSTDERSLVYATDVEFPEGMDAKMSRLCRGTDVLVHDAQYLDEEYFDTSRPREGFGHSTVSMAARNAAGMDVEKLFLFHYDPGHDDNSLEAALVRCREQFPASFLARENQRIEIS
ncbi:MAG TPA: MBL fold metallo-hydrolase [Candidatus Aminicenantes bacterium]|nr:MBL fold metallo-hydrolase [Candidatus Aminicenantes bacterium]